MDNNKIAVELVRIAKELIGRSELDDAYEDIAMDVASRMTERRMSVEQAFNDIGYGWFLKYTRVSDTPLGWEVLPLVDMAKVLTRAIQKGATRYVIQRR